MTTWEQLALDSLRAAKLLLQEGFLRSCVNRSYFGAYAAATARLAERRVQFPHGGNNPTHEQLPRLILNNLELSEHNGRRVAAAVRRLRYGRAEADYIPAAHLDRGLARDFVRDASTVLELLEVRNDDED
jgi:uncharacterized protein (UPF0332 family)